MRILRQGWASSNSRSTGWPGGRMGGVRILELIPRAVGREVSGANWYFQKMACEGCEIKQASSYDVKKPVGLREKQMEMTKGRPAPSRLVMGWNRVSRCGHFVGIPSLWKAAGLVKGAESTSSRNQHVHISVCGVTWSQRFSKIRNVNLNSDFVSNCWENLSLSLVLLCPQPPHPPPHPSLVILLFKKLR